MKRLPSRYVFLAAALSIFAAIVMIADSTSQSLPFSQNWSNAGLITTSDDWTGVPGIIGYRGDGLTASTGVDPQTVVADGTLTPVDVNANQTAPNTFTTGGVSEFEITDPVVALQGSGTADAPFILLHLNSTGLQAVTVAYNLRDIDGSADNAVQPVALQFRAGSSGDFTNVPAGFVPDATTGPGLATLVTPVNVVLPAAADNQPVLQVRVITTDASGSDEWVGIDDIQVTGTPIGGSTDPSGAGAADPAVVDAGETTLLTMSVTPGANPTSTGLAVTADLTAIGGSATQPFFDDGSSGDAIAGDNVFSFEALVAFGTSPGNKSLPATITDAEARSGAANIFVTVRSDIVVSQIYGGGGNSGATLRNDFIELFNRGTSTIDVTGWSVQYASAAGTTWQKTDLVGSIAPGHYYLVQEAAGTGGTDDLPTPDASGGIPMSATAGKVALVNDGTLLTGTGCPFAASVQDFVGYGGANCAEGASTAPPSNTTAVLRALNGCLDNGNNAADFGTGAPTPRNSSSPAQSCIPVELEIHEIQGSGNVSPHAGALVRTTGIVTGRKSNGFFLQAGDGAADSDANTSEGIFVFTSSAPPAAAGVGNSVEITGAVQEFVPSQDLHSPPLTEIVGSPTVTLVSTGNPLPAAIELTAADTSPSGPIEQLERFEGMRVSVSSLTVIGPTQGSVDEPNATSTSNGVFYGVITGVARPFREPGVQVPDPLPPGSPCCVPRFDLNPERLRVDSDALGAAALEVTTGATVTGLVGPLDYGFRTYTIDPDPPPSPAPAVSGNVSATPVPGRTADEFTVASFNIERFFDTVDDPGIGEPVLSSTAFNNRLSKASLAIRNVLRTPDILGVVEAENLAALQALADKVNADAVAAAQPNPNYLAFLQEGNDPGGIDVGFLVSDARVNVVSVTQEGKDTTFIDPTDGSEDVLNDRPPLVLKAKVVPTAAAEFPVLVIVNHLRSLNDVAQDPGAGPRVREKRRKQAEFLANLIQTLQTANSNERIFSVGDYNAFQFSDGLVDLIGTIKGAPTPAEQVVLASDDLVNPDLVDLVDGATANQRYSYVFDGNAQVLDHVLMSGNLTGRLRRFTHARLDADFPGSLRNDPNRPERLSDHDAPVAFLTLDPDGDGVFDDGDACTASSPSATVVIDGCDSRAGNDLSADGCKITDRIAACAASALTHDDFTQCVGALTTQLRNAGLITNKEKGDIQKCAAKADIP